MMGLGSIVGTGIFVSIGVAAGSAGASVILAIAVAAIVATCNALSSAQLAASHAVSGGTYEYGYRYLHPLLGFTAGWMFLCAKTASAATAAISINLLLNYQSCCIVFIKRRQALSSCFRYKWINCMPIFGILGSSKDLDCWTRTNNNRTYLALHS